MSQPADRLAPTISGLEKPLMGEENSKNVDISLGHIRQSLEHINELVALYQEILSHGTEKELPTLKANIITYCWQTLQAVTYAQSLIVKYRDYRRWNVSSSYSTKLSELLTAFT